MKPVSRETVNGIPGVEVVKLQSWPDDRGCFREVFRSEWAPVEFSGQVQLNLSETRAGALRGLHFHRVQWDWWVPVRGRIRAAVADLRDDSPTFLQTAVLELSGEGNACLLVPPRVAHGFLALTETTLLYAVNRFYDGNDEQGTAWDDPILSIDWGEKNPVLSERDRSNPTVEDLFPGVNLRNRS
jgi:dTDP-4-dehydrorhamnose 3,5-epimerase